jgi:hypothetical protein
VPVLGDLNAYAREEPISYLEAAGFVNLTESFLGAGADSFIFDGQSGTLDYALATPCLLSQISGTGEWHINADEPDAVDYNLNFGRDPSLFDGTTPFRSSDHDPVIVGLQLAEPALPPIPSNALILAPIGSYASGQEGVGEIVAYDPITRRLFSLNGEHDRLDVLDIADPSRPALVFPIDLSARRWREASSAPIPPPTPLRYEPAACGAAACPTRARPP